MHKKHLFTKSGIAASVVGLAVISSSALGAGFEKNVLWSGKWVGVGGAAVSGVNGAESLFFNPAGLASGRQGFEVSGNFSPTWGEFQGPIAAPGVQESSGYKFSPVYGALASYGLTPQWGIGVGSYVSAGTKAVYDNVTNFPSLAPLTASGKVQATVYAVEYAIGTGYEILPGLKLGAAWRIVHVSASLGTPYQTGAAGFSFADIDSLSGTRYNGFRAGAQYISPDDKWGLGINWRSSVDFTLSGGGTVTTKSLVTPFGTTSANVSDVTAASALPTQIEVGGNYRVLDAVRLYLDYVWTNYGHNQTLSVTGGSTANTSGVGVPSIPLGWTNMSNIRVGASCTEVPDWIFRAGYVWTSQVTPDGFARATFASPGHGNTITLGTGRQFMNKALDVDLALEHSWASGSTTAAQQAVYGDYFTSDWAAHLGFTYRL
jgi:long-chain fatty acid transport protein